MKNEATCGTCKGRGVGPCATLTNPAPAGFGPGGVCQTCGGSGYTAFAPGDRITTSGFHGTVVRQYTPGMVEVRLLSGLVVVPNVDVIRVPR